MRHRPGGRFRLLILAACCLAAAGLSIPAVSATGRLLASSSAAGGRTAAAGQAALAGTSATPAASASSGGAAAGSCSAVYFVSAMGSGQASKYAKTSDIPTTGPAAEALSPQTDAVYRDMTQQLNDQGITTAPTFYQLPYAAPSIDMLQSGVTMPSGGSGVTALARDEQVLKADWNRVVNTNLVNYIAGELQGESELYTYLTQVYDNCHAAGRQPMVVLTGYSQGAMVVHNVLNTLAGGHDASLSALIKGAVLIADPERMPNSDVANFGTAPLGDYGLCHAVDLVLAGVTTLAGGTRPSCVAPDKTTDVASQFSSVDYQICDSGDLVCDTSGLFKLNSHGAPPIPANLGELKQEVNDFKQEWKTGKQVHSDHYTGDEARTAGRRVARNLVLDGLGTQPSPPASPSPSVSPSSGSTGPWTAAQAPLPAGGLSGNVTGVSCPSASECFAVGVYTYGTAGNEQGGGLLLTGSQGSWTAAQAPVPGNAVLPEPVINLGGVSCPTVSWCVAVGEYSAAGSGASSSGQVLGLLLTYSGGTWTAAQAPLPAEAAGTSAVTMTGVSCASVSSCVAVGYYSGISDAPETAGLLLTDSGGTWTAATAPVPADALTAPSTAEDAIPGAELTGVSCVSASSCVAVGGYVNTSGYYGGTVLTDAAGTWTVTAAPVPADAKPASPGTNSGENLNGVSCPSASRCVAAGFYLPSGQGDQGLLLTDSGGTWTAAQAPPIAGQKNGALLQGVSCSSADDCLAVGWFEDSDTLMEGDLLTDAGGSWTAAQAPAPAGLTPTPTVGLFGVSCASAASCVASGESMPGGPLLLTESG